jgi:hypothetical protein
MPRDNDRDAFLRGFEAGYNAAAEAALTKMKEYNAEIDHMRRVADEIRARTIEAAERALRDDGQLLH